MEKNKSNLLVYALGGITVVAILIISIIWGISSRAATEPSPKPSVAAAPPRATREVSAQNTPAASESDLLDFEINEVSGSQMALAIAEKTKVQGFTEAEFSALCDDTVKPLMDGGCEWVTIDFGDGTGIVFTGGLAHYPTYGEIDSNGSLLKSIGDITCKDGSVTYQAK